MATDKNMTALHETLDGLELDDLRQVQKKVEKLIAGYQDRKRREAISAAEGVLKEHGFKLTDLFGDSVPAKGGKTASGKGPVPAKYANPENPEETWSGRGRRPAWVREALDAGRSLGDFEI